MSTVNDSKDSEDLDEDVDKQHRFIKSFASLISSGIFFMDLALLICINSTLYYVCPARLVKLMINMILILPLFALPIGAHGYLFGYRKELIIVSILCSKSVEIDLN